LVDFLNDFIFISFTALKRVNREMEDSKKANQRGLKGKMPLKFKTRQRLAFFDQLPNSKKNND
jgi:hypothetical protein